MARLIVGLFIGGLGAALVMRALLEWFRVWRGTWPDPVIDELIRPPRRCYDGFDPRLRDLTARRRRQAETVQRIAAKLREGSAVAPAVEAPADPRPARPAIVRRFERTGGEHDETRAES